MKKEEILNKIGQIIQDLKDQHQYLTETENFNLLELELFTANADFLIDHLEILKKLETFKFEQKIIETPSQLSSENTPKIPLTNEANITEDVGDNSLDFVELELPVKSIETDLNKDEMLFDFEQGVKIEEIYDRTLSEEENRILQEKKNLTFAEEPIKDIIPIKTEEILHEIKQEQSDSIVKINDDDGGYELDEKPNSPILSSESFNDETLKPVVNDVKKQTLNEMLSSNQSNNNLSTRFVNLPSSDLKSVISLNDKLLFIKELFNGYNLAYSEAIEILNRFDSFESADNFLQKNYAVKNKWNEKQSTVDRFYEILNRKYLK